MVFTSWNTEQNTRSLLLPVSDSKNTLDMSFVKVGGILVLYKHKRSPFQETWKTIGFFFSLFLLLFGERKELETSDKSCPAIANSPY